MDGLIRGVAISLEWFLLVALLGCVLGGLWLTIFDLGMKVKYRKAINLALVAMGAVISLFFIAHLVAFYPTF